MRGSRFLLLAILLVFGHIHPVVGLVATSTTSSPTATGTPGATFTLPISGRVTATIKPFPWSGYYWPQDGHPLSRVLSKYDKFVTGRTGANPGAAAWERRYHDSEIEWAGHCNGWSAASVLHPEPRAPRTVDGITFSIGDQKGLLSEQYMDCYYKFFGTRANKSSPVDPDILPHHFHRILLEFMKEKKLAIVVDIDAGSPVWNYPVYAFDTNWTVSPDRTRADVTTQLYLVQNDVKADFVGTKGFVKTYRYSLFLNPAGEVTGGSWAKGTGRQHPDFIWVPVADCPAGSWENPNLDPAMVRAILGLPEPPPPATGTPASTPTGPASVTATIMASIQTVGTGDPFESVLREAGLDPETLF